MRWLMLAWMVMTGCATVTPAMRAAVDVVACRYKTYVREDAKLTFDEQTMRVDMAEALRMQAGLHGPCSDVGR